MKLEFETVTKENGKESIKIICDGVKMGAYRLANLPEAQIKGLSPQIIWARIKAGFRTEEKIFASRHYKKKGSKADGVDFMPGGDFEGCSPEYIRILKFGTNKELLAYNVNKGSQK